MKSMFVIPRCRAACSQRFHLAWYKQFVGGELGGCQVVPWLSFPRVIFFIVKFVTNELKSTYFGCMKRDLKGNSRENYPCFLSSLWFPNGM